MTVPPGKLRPGITYRPVTAVSPSQVCVAWPPANDTNPVVQDFVRSCLDNKPPHPHQPPAPPGPARP